MAALGEEMVGGQPLPRSSVRKWHLAKDAELQLTESPHLHAPSVHKQRKIKEQHDGKSDKRPATSPILLKMSQLQLKGTESQHVHTLSP